MVLVTTNARIGLICRYERDKIGRTRLTHRAQAEPEERPFTFSHMFIGRFRNFPNEELAVDYGIIGWRE